MDGDILAFVGVALSAKIFSDLIRRDFGNSPRHVLWHGVTVDATYVAILFASAAASAYLGPTVSVPVALLLRTGALLNSRILLAANHAVLEWLYLLVLWRLQDVPLAGASLLQALTTSVWIYAAVQKVYHREFLNGSYFYLVLQARRADARWPSLFRAVPRLRGYSALPEPTAAAFCRRLAVAVVAGECIFPIVAILASGTTVGYLTAIVAAFAIGYASRETNFMITNLVMSAVLTVPFDFALLLTATHDPVIAIIFLWFVLWPLCHAVVTRHCLICPWKLAGWGMYSVVLPRIALVDSTGHLAAAPRSVAVSLVQLYGACRYHWLRSYVQRIFNRWHHDLPAAGFVLRRYVLRGDVYVTACVVLPSNSCTPVRAFELREQADADNLHFYLASLATQRER
jgi:hypothetical protein